MKSTNINKQNFTTYKNLTALKNYPINRFEEGETVFLKEENQLYIYHDNNWQPLADSSSIENKSAGISMSLYELNKSVIMGLPALTNFDEEKKALTNFHNKENSEYYMLLCKDISYYTIFKDKNEFDLFGTPNHFAEEVIDCLLTLGEVVSIDLKQEKDGFEIWIKMNGEVYCMYLFNCTPFVVEF